MDQTDDSDIEPPMLPLALPESLHTEFTNQKLTSSTRTELLQGVTRDTDDS